MSEEARKVEAKSGLAEVEWRGHKFTISTEYDDWSVDFTESLEEGKSVGVVRGALGPRQWRVIRGMNLKNRDLGELANVIARALGFESTGESQASVD